jgi:hypothetical protein
MKIAILAGLVLPLMGTPAPASADISANVSFSIGAPPGEPVSSVDVFYDQLAPYGVWVDEPRLNRRVFVPQQEDFVPYRVGHWESTDVGFVWVSNEPFAWATTHYGRWAYSPEIARWVWMPDTEWGPSWVDWREGDGAIGWAPLAPDYAINAGYTIPTDSWHYCDYGRVLDVNVGRYYVPRERVVVIERNARPISYRTTVNNRTIIAGPSPQVLREHRVAFQPKRVDAKVLGRARNAEEARVAVQRAQQRRVEVDRANQQRIQQNTKLRTAVERVQKTAPKQAVNQQEQRATQQRATQQRETQQRAEQQQKAQQERATQQRETQQRAEQQKQQAQKTQQEQRANQQNAQQERATQQRETQQQRAEQQKAQQQQAQKAQQEQRANQQREQQAQKAQQQQEQRATQQRAQQEQRAQQQQKQQQQQQQKRPEPQPREQRAQPQPKQQPQPQKKPEPQAKRDDRKRDRND